VTTGTPSAPGALLKDLSPSEYSRVSALLDQAIEMTPEARDAWLRELERGDAKSAAVLRDMFASMDGGQALGFLEVRDLVVDSVASMVEGPRGLIGRQFGPYRVLSLLGHGGMGSVWLAERVDGLFTRRVALKLLHPALMGRAMSERVTREREILAGLNHPNIARLIDAGFAEDGQPYLALEYVAGVPLTAYCDECRLPIRERLELFRQVLSAVQYAHANLVIHRDLKPSNIMVTEQGQVYLLDFGIAKLLTEGEAKETELTRLGGRALTPDYAAPEQMSGAPITTAADVYALGVMLYELITGERPYKLKRDTRGALEEAILRADPVAPSRAAMNETAAYARATTVPKLAKSLKGDLDTIVAKALKKSPNERYATANAFGEDIARYLQGDVVLAQRDSVAYRALKFARRHRVAIAAAAVLVLTLAGGLAATSYEAKVASEQRDAAREAQLRSITQTAAARVTIADIPAAMGIILEVLPRRGSKRPYTAEALSVFQEARAADSLIFAMTGHTDRVRSAAFSPDGARMVTASYDKTARIWDAATGREIRLPIGSADRLTSAAFSPDGKRIVTASVDMTARVWDAATGQAMAVLTGHADRLTTAVFSPDGLHVLTASSDKTARIWDALTGRQILLLNGHAEGVNCAAFSPDGHWVVTASDDTSVRLWDAATGRPMMFLNGHTDRVRYAAFSPDGARIVTASADKTARIWDTATGRQIVLLNGHTDRLTTAGFSPDGRRIVTASYDKTARIWDTATGQQLAVLNGHTDLVETAAFSPDGRRIATASDDQSVRIWDAAPGREILRMNGHLETVTNAAFSPDGRQLATTSTDKTARLWDTATGRQILLLSGHTGTVTSTGFSPDGGRIITASFDKSARIWDAATGRQIMKLDGHTDTVSSASFSPDARHILTSSLDKTARIWDASTGRQILLLSGHSDLVETAAFSADGRRVVTASNDGTARIWDAATGRQYLVLSGHTDQVVAAAFSPDGRRIATASLDKTARIWDAATGRQIQVLSGHTDAVETAAFSPDGRRIITASADRTARIWDAATGQQVEVLSGHADMLESASFSPDGNIVVTASDDRTARLWPARADAIDDQIDWAEAAQFDPLPSTERFQLGLTASADVRQWPADRSKCDEAAAAPYDPDRLAAGFMQAQIVTDIAIAACANESSRFDGQARLSYQQGRALMANGKFTAAAQKFEAAVAHRYRAARTDLASLLAQPSAQILDLPRAISLYEQAWKDGVTLAAFELGSLYEHGVPSSDEAGFLLLPDQPRAWLWYRKAADSGEANALARFAEQEDGAAFAEQNTARKTAHLLESFKYYAAASDRARREDWPDEAWRKWRYRRASLARLLEREGMMRELADAYDDVRKRYAAPATAAN
jgi:WD40 repeat protein/tRNA A-37 threonylcarbamoyl transferase component Bud32/TPR repeat protein